MIFTKKKRFKPSYKKFFNVRENVQNRQKLLKFKKKKWEKLIKNYKRRLKRYKKFKPKNQSQYLVFKYSNRGTSYKKRYKNTLQTIKKFRLFYGDLRKKTIKKYIGNILKKNLKDNKIAFIESFEKKLDTVLYRAKFCPSIKNSQQLIVHGKVLVNNKETRVSSYNLKTGDLISIKPNSYKLIEENIRHAQIWPIPPKHLLINYKTMQIIVGNIKHTNLSLMFPFNLNLEKILTKFT